MTAPAPGYVEVILITGPSGSGKTTVAFELSAILQDAQVHHALIDTDELDRIFPVPRHQSELTRRNLRSVWRGFEELGCSRLILCGVMSDLNEEMTWLTSALPSATVSHAFRLRAAPETVRARLMQREIGTRLEQHLQSSDRARSIINSQRDAAIVIETDARLVPDIAAEILSHTSWARVDPE